MKNSIKALVYKILPSRLKKHILNNLIIDHVHNYTSYSQEGEDKIIEKFFGTEKRSGFYIDIGANHPFDYSNTYKFYLKGWRGINIDAMPGSMAIFNKIRRNDINIEIGIGEASSQQEFYTFNSSVFNTFDKQVADQHCKEFNINIVKTLSVNIMPLADILKQHIVPFFPIDFMSIDTEGYELQVLKSNNWDHYKPKIVLIEILNSDLVNYRESDAIQFLISKGYSPFAKTYNTVFLKHELF